MTGESGETPFVASGGLLFLGKGDGEVPVARVLPDLAILVDRPPWVAGGQGPALGVALN